MFDMRTRVNVKNKYAIMSFEEWRNNHIYLMYGLNEDYVRLYDLTESKIEGDYTRKYLAKALPQREVVEKGFWKKELKKKCNFEGEPLHMTRDTVYAMNAEGNKVCIVENSNNDVKDYKIVDLRVLKSRLMSL